MVTVKVLTHLERIRQKNNKTDTKTANVGWAKKCRLFICSYVKMFAGKKANLGTVANQNDVPSKFGMWSQLKEQSLQILQRRRNWLHGASWEVAFLHFWPATVFVCSQSPEEKGETEEGGDASKSEISLVYEIALKRNLSVNFEVRGEKQRTCHFQVYFSPP